MPTWRYSADDDGCVECDSPSEELEEPEIFLQRPAMARPKIDRSQVLLRFVLCRGPALTEEQVDGLNFGPIFAETIGHSLGTTNMQLVTF